MPDHGSLDRHDQHWLRHERFVYAGREVTYDELRADAEGQAAGLDPDQWIGGEFDFRLADPFGRTCAAELFRVTTSR